MVFQVSLVTACEEVVFNGGFWENAVFIKPRPRWCILNCMLLIVMLCIQSCNKSETSKWELLNQHLLIKAHLTSWQLSNNWDYSNSNWHGKLHCRHVIYREVMPILVWKLTICVLIQEVLRHLTVGCTKQIIVWKLMLKTFVTGLVRMEELNLHLSSCKSFISIKYCQSIGH